MVDKNIYNHGGTQNNTKSMKEWILILISLNRQDRQDISILFFLDHFPAPCPQGLQPGGKKMVKPYRLRRIGNLNIPPFSSET